MKCLKVDNKRSLIITMVPAIPNEAYIEIKYCKKIVAMIGIREIEDNGLTTFKGDFGFVIKQSLLSGIVADMFIGTTIGDKLRTVIDKYGEENNGDGIEQGYTF